MTLKWINNSITQALNLGYITNEHAEREKNIPKFIKKPVTKPIFLDIYIDGPTENA